MATPTLLMALIVLLAACPGNKGATAEAQREAPAKSSPAQEAASDPTLPEVDFGELEVEGTRDGGPVLVLAKENVGSLRRCYADRLKKDPTLKGKLALRFLIAPKGDVEDVLVHNNKLTDHQVATCMLRVVKTWHFPANNDPDGTKIVMPMDLAPPKKAG